jgi:hypothetical protein
MIWQPKQDLAKISKFVEELHGQANGDGLYSALLRLHALQVCV